jgi:hypothetical protein
MSEIPEQHQPDPQDPDPAAGNAPRPRPTMATARSLDRDSIAAPTSADVPSHLEVVGSYPCAVDLPEIRISWHRCTPSIDVLSRLLLVLANIPANLYRRPGPESDQR